MGMTALAASPAGDMATYRALAGRSRQALLAALRRSGRPLDAGEAGAAVGLHRNTARVHLDLLCKAGLLRRRLADDGTRGRPRVLYEPVANTVGVLDVAGYGAKDAGYRELAGLLAQQLAELADVPEEAIRAGRRWVTALDEHPLPAQWLTFAEATAVMTDLLGRLGFDAEPEPGSSRILLHRCPFAELARGNRTVVCGIHLGMITATAERLDSPLRVVGLDPFVTDEPNLCVVSLAAKARSRARDRRSEEAAS